MPTDKPRINVTMSVADYELLSTLARQQKRSRADMLRDLFETMRPVLERVAVVSEAAQRAQATARQGMIDSAEKAEAEILPMVQQALGQFDLFMADIQAKAGAAAEMPAQTAPAPPQTPVPVITGVRSSRTGGKTPRKVSRKAPSRAARSRVRKAPRRHA